MTASVLTLLLSGFLLLAALGGPWVLRHAAPALVSVPRFAAPAVTIITLLWITALVALGPIVAWMSSGPAWLPKQAAEVCNRCLSAATPFGDGALSLGIPAVIPLALPTVGAVAVVAGLVREIQRNKRSRSILWDAIYRTSEPTIIFGYRLRLNQETRLQAFSLPYRYGGIILSRGAVAALSNDELRAVLEHEQAHLSQRHHVCLTILNGATHYFCWIPLVRAVREAVPHYLEIAADNAAQEKTGTFALASALLKLGQPATLQTAIPMAAHAVLHMAGSERVRHLVGYPRPPASLALAAAIGMYAFMLAAAITAIHWPYLLAIATGC
ncbi:MAG: M56 family metallopeptidase [Canibacter sp.]